MYSAKFKRKKLIQLEMGRILIPIYSRGHPPSQKKKKKLEIKCELKLDRYTYYHIHEIDIKDHGINPSTYIEIKREKRKEIKKR